MTKGTMGARGAVGEPALVSVVMPIRNEGASISRSLGRVLDQTYPADRLEVIVADGMSTDGTREAVERLQASRPNLRLVDNPGRIVAPGLNAGIRASRGSIIVRIDGHTEISPDYVEQCVAALERSGADNAGGRMQAVGDRPFGEAVAAATSSRFGVGGARFHYSDKEEWVDTVYMGAWRREIFERVGLFDEELVRDQDDEFNYRLRAAGGRILLVPSIRSLYTVRGSPARLWKQYFQYGYWKVRVLQKHTRQMQPRQFAPPLFVASLAALAVAAPFSRLSAAALALLVLSYVAANGAASLRAAKGRGRLVLPIALAFAILHISYGAGFLAGCVRFAGRWGDHGPAPAVTDLKKMEQET